MCLTCKLYQQMVASAIESTTQMRLPSRQSLYHQEVWNLGHPGQSRKCTRELLDCSFRQGLYCVAKPTEAFDSQEDLILNKFAHKPNKFSDKASEACWQDTLRCKKDEQFKTACKRSCLMLNWKGMVHYGITVRTPCKYFIMWQEGQLLRWWTTLERTAKVNLSVSALQDARSGRAEYLESILKVVCRCFEAISKVIWRHSVDILKVFWRYPVGILKVFRKYFESIL